MTDHQSGIFDKQFSDHIFIEYALAHGAAADQVKTAIGAVTQLANEDAAVTIALGPQLWRQLGGNFNFPPFSLEGRVPATQGDLLIWVQSRNRSVGFDVSRAISKCLGDRFSIHLEIQGFVYHDMRDLTGFVDGIGNPDGEAALEAALVPDNHPGGGGSFVLTQKWQHDLDSFEHLSVDEQENVFGRTKQDAVEFDDERMPVDAHVGRTDAARGGVPQKIWRRSVPFGGTTEHGLYFVAFSCELDRFDYLLKRMFAMVDDHVQDRMTNYTTPVMSSWWYAPTQSFLNSLGLADKNALGNRA